MIFCFILAICNQEISLTTDYINIIINAIKELLKIEDITMDNIQKRLMIQNIKTNDIQECSTNSFFTNRKSCTKILNQLLIEMEKNNLNYCDKLIQYNNELQDIINSNP